MSKKTAIAVTIAPELLARVDRVAESREESRSAVMERMLRNQIQEEETLVNQLANPALRETMAYIAESPKLLKALAFAMGEHLPKEEIERVGSGWKKLREVGKRLQAEKSGAHRKTQKG
jgi:metal-responsive CopG/Arc/MetJ family transcriptional regulator